MAKLIVLALAFTALAAFASAHTTIVTTTTGNDNPTPRQCSQQLQGESFNQCESYLHQQGQQQGIQQCCQELQRVDEQCQCAAVEKVFRDVQRQQQQQQGQQGGMYGSQQLQRLKMKAQNLPNQCNLQTRQCPIRTSITTTTITTDDNPFWPFGSQQCSRSEVQGRSFNQCQRYIEQQISRFPRTLLMSINRQRETRPGLQQCCNELQNVRQECQCEAMNEVYRQAMQQVQQGGQYEYGRRQQQRGGQYEYGRRQQQHGGQYGGQQEMEAVRSVVQNLRNECNLDVQQCQIPSSMF